MVAALPAFAGVERDALRQVLPGAHLLTPELGELLIDQDAKPARILFVIAGKLHVFITYRAKKALIAWAEAGQQVGAPAVMADSQRHLISVAAAAESQVLALDADAYLRLLDLSSTFRRSQLRVVMTNAIGMTRRAAEVASLDVAGRLRALLTRLAADAPMTPGGERLIAPAPSHRQMAELIGCSPEGVTRELRTLSDAGHISRRRGVIRVMKLDDLSLGDPPADAETMRVAMGEAAELGHIHHIRAFSALSEAGRTSVLTSSTVTRLPKGQALASSGAPVEHVYFVVSGALRATRQPSPDRADVVALSPAGAQFGAMAALADAECWEMSIVADDESVVLRLPSATYLSLIDSEPAFRSEQIRLVGGHAVAQGVRAAELAALDLGRRLRAALLRLSEERPDGDGQRVIKPAPTHARLADVVASRREVVTRELNALQRDGLIRLERGEIILVRPGQL